MSTPSVTDVSERLERLAGQAPTRSVDPVDVWARGRRRQRAHWVGTAACLTVLAVLGATWLPTALHRSPDLVAVSPDSALRLPDVIRQPGEWEPAFEGAPGRLVAVGSGSRSRWWGQSGAVWGVSGANGEARFLDLPDAVVSAPGPALSADGTRLAYWIGGSVAEGLPAGGAGAVTGVAVMDLLSGEVARWESQASYGLMATGMAWSGDLLWWSAGPLRPGPQPGTTSAEVRSRTWDLSTDGRRELARGEAGWDLSLHDAGPAPDGFVAVDQSGLIRVRGAVVGDPLALDTPVSAAAAGPGAIAGVERPDPAVTVGGRVEPLLVGAVGATLGRPGRPVRMEPVGGVLAHAVLGWRSEDQVVVASERADDGRVQVLSVHAWSGEAARLLEVEGTMPSSIAADAWGGEVIEAPDAPWAPDPRLIGAFLLVVGAFVISLVNSMRRRRAGA